MIGFFSHSWNMFKIPRVIFVWCWFELNVLFSFVLLLIGMLLFFSQDLLDRAIAFQEDARAVLLEERVDSRSLEKCLEMGLNLDIEVAEIPQLKQVKNAFNNSRFQIIINLKKKKNPWEFFLLRFLPYLHQFLKHCLMSSYILLMAFLYGCHKIH